MFLDLFHTAMGPTNDSSPARFERLYNWSRSPAPGESFLSDFYLSNLDFFAIASFSKLGVENPQNISWYPLFPSVDPTSTLAPIAIPKRAWLENCHIRWFDRLSSVDGVSFVLADSSTSPDGLMHQLNRGFNTLLTQPSREDPTSHGLGSYQEYSGILPWYNPMELLSAIGTRREDSLANWIPTTVHGIVFPIRVSRLSFALARPSSAKALRERGFHSYSAR
jgi:hypothetical protein